MGKLIVRASTLALVLAIATPVAGHAAPKSSGPTLFVVGEGASGAASQPGTEARVAVGGVASLDARSLDPARQVVLYKGRLADDPSMSGWEYLYYRAYSAAADGTLWVDETQDRAGTYRYQVCQYHEGRRARWVCSDYVQLTVG